MKRVFNKNDWKRADGASPTPKRLKLEPDEQGLYVCPVENCESDRYKSQRGCRKHVFVKHGWYYYFEKKPDVRDVFPAALLQPTTARQARRRMTWDMPSFSPKCKLAEEFVSWICSAGGGGKDMNQAEQLCKKILKYCKYSCPNLDEDFEVTRSVVEYCVGSVEHLQKFMTFLEEECKLASAGVIAYLQSLSHCLDFLRFQGLRADSIATLVTTEVFLSRAKQCLRKKMRVEWKTVLSIEHLESVNCWASLTELQKVLPFYEVRFAQVVNLARGDAVGPHDLTFATSFIVTVMFLKVKGSRPMTYQFLTVPMVRSALRTGVIDQAQFKTEEKYGFDSLIFTDYVLDKLKSYDEHIRPKLHPACDFFFVCKNGTQLANLGDIFGRMVHQAVGKYVNPTRYRQIIETESSDLLSDKEREMISLDQKHTSNVAKVHYQKKRSRNVAKNAMVCMEKLIRNSQNNGQSSVTPDRDERQSEENESRGEDDDETQGEDGEETQGEDARVAEAEPAVVTKRNSLRNCAGMTRTSSETRDAVGDETANWRRKKNSFSREEDAFLLKGIRKHGKGKWTQILKDPEYGFHPSRKNSTLMMRARAKKFI